MKDETGSRQSSPHSATLSSPLSSVDAVQVVESFDLNRYSSEGAQASSSKVGQERGHELSSTNNSIMLAQDYHTASFDDHSYELLLRTPCDHGRFLKYLAKDNFDLYKKTRELEVGKEETHSAMQYQKQYDNDIESASRDIRKLRNQVKHLESMAGLFWKRPDIVPSNRTSQQIQTHFKQMIQLLKVTSGKNEFQFVRQDLWSQDAKQLFEAASIIDSPHLLSLGSDPCPEEMLLLEELIVCIIGISIQEWVFKPALWCPALLETPLLQRYKELNRVLRKSISIENS